MTCRFVVVDDHPLFRAALSQVLADRAVIEEVGTLELLLERLRTDSDIDLVLLDLNLPGTHGYSGLLLIRTEFPQVPVIVVSAIDDPVVACRCLALGASGFLSKTSTPATIRQAVDRVLGGEIWSPPFAETGPGETAAWRRFSTLSAQQVRVLMMLSTGLMNKQIAHELDIAEATVKVHVSAILQKLGVQSRTQAAVLARSLERPTISGPEKPGPR
jgi:DNA-binding NarL/FixJ family response regulator